MREYQVRPRGGLRRVADAVDYARDVLKARSPARFKFFDDPSAARLAGEARAARWHEAAPDRCGRHEVMASAFPGSPRVLKGALVVFETPAPVPTNIIAFQFNPDQVSRTFRQQAGDEDPCGSSGDTMFVLPPTETLALSVELDATDELERGDAVATATGLHPTLAALELLLYPSSIDLILDKALALAGSARVRAGPGADRPARLGPAARRCPCASSRSRSPRRPSTRG